MSQRIIYTCKKCGWHGSIEAAWADIKPKKCLNRKCQTSFIKYPEDLIIEVPKVSSSKGETSNV